MQAPWESATLGIGPAQPRTRSLRNEVCDHSGHRPGKYKSVACAYRSGGTPTFLTLSTTPDALLALLRRAGPAVVVIEACALAGWVHDLCARRGWPCKVANTAGEAWKFKHTRRKTDRDDALRLAQLEALGQLPTVTIPPAEVRQRRALIVARQRLVGLRVRVQNRLRALLVARGIEAPRGASAWTAAGLAAFQRQAKALAGCAVEELWRGRAEVAAAADAGAEQSQVRGEQRRAGEVVDRRQPQELADQPPAAVVPAPQGVAARTEAAISSHLAATGSARLRPRVAARAAAAAPASAAGDAGSADRTRAAGTLSTANAR